MTDGDDWRPLASTAALEQRAVLLQTARQFFSARGVMEVETPVLASTGVTDAGISSLATTVGNTKMWLRTSPEYHMKRLLANGSPDIYQIAKVFREGEIGRRHQPEFTMAEWYRLGFTLEQMIDDSCQFIHTLINAVAPAKQAFEQPKVHRYREIFCAAIQLDPMTASMQSLQNCATTVPGWHEALGQQLSHDRNAWLDFIASHAVLPQLPANGLQVIRDYPAAQAMLARLNPDRPDVADRFEIFMGGMELANGFRELTDADEQRQRFAADNARRQTSGLPTMSIDTHLLNALEGGLPDCSGVAVGLDRVLMLAGDHDDISATLSFHPGN